MNDDANAAQLNQITELDFRFLNLRFLPEEIQKLTQLERLYLSGNNLISLPADLGKLSNLQVLELSDNQLTSVPKELENLKDLILVFLKNNPLLFASDKELDKINNYGDYLALLEPLKKYTPQSPLAALFHAIIFNEAVGVI